MDESLKLMNEDGLIDSHVLKSEIDIILNRYMDTEDERSRSSKLFLDLSKLQGRILGELVTLHTLKRSSLKTGKRK